jgi:hypothetical protein
MFKALKWNFTARLFLIRLLAKAATHTAISRPNYPATIYGTREDNPLPDQILSHSPYIHALFP